MSNKRTTPKSNKAEETPQNPQEQANESITDMKLSIAILKKQVEILERQLKDSQPYTNDDVRELFNMRNNRG